MTAAKRYNYKPKPAIVRFEDMPGLEMEMRPVPVGRLLDMFVAADDMEAGKATPEMVTGLFAMFADTLKSWNLDVDGEPVPATVDGIRSLDPDLFTALFRGWADGLMQAPKAPQTPSRPGPLPEGTESLPMEPLSVVRAS